MKTSSLFASLSALLVVAAIGVYFVGRAKVSPSNSEFAGNKLVRSSRTTSRTDDQPQPLARQHPDPASVVSSAPTHLAPASLTAAYPEITTRVTDWKKFNREAKSIVAAPFPETPLNFSLVRLKDEGKYVTWIGTDKGIPGSSLVAVATPSGSYDSVMILPGTSQFSFHTESDGTTRVTESNPADETCAVGGVQTKATPAAPLSAALFKAQYTGGAQAAMAALGFDANGAQFANAPVIGAPQASTNVDVLFLFDADMLAFAATQSSNPVGFIDGLSKAMIESSNVLLTNSAITNYQWRYLGAVQSPAYTRPTISTFVDSNGVSHATTSLLADLNAMRPGGAIGTFVSKTRFDFGADQIILWRGDRFADASGQAFSTKQVPVAKDSSLVVVLQGLSFKTIAHEMGHNFGCQHERDAPNNPGQTSNSRDGDGFHAYAIEFSIPSQIPGGSGNTAGTIMTAGSGATIPFFSTPDITIRVTSALAQQNGGIGDWGIQTLGLPVGNPRAAFNSKVLTDNASAMAALVEEITAPLIVTQPSGATVNSGGSLNLSVAAVGGGLNFQWSKDGAPISGATASVFSKTAFSADAGSYSVSVTNLVGAVTSATATVSVSAVTTPPPTGGGSGGGSSGGGGGGGAPSEWFLGALTILTLLRRSTSKRR